MPDALPLRWLPGAGWLALAGAPDASGEIRSLALNRWDQSGELVCLSLAADAGDALMDDLADLGAPTAYLIDLDDDEPESIHARLGGAGMIIVEAPTDASRTRHLMTSAIAAALREALDNGGLLLLEGLAAALAGKYTVAAGQVKPGLRLVSNAFIVVDADSVLRSDDAARILARDPRVAGIAIQRGAALALGPEGRVETWGAAQVTFGLVSRESLADAESE